MLHLHYRTCQNHSSRVCDCLCKLTSPDATGKAIAFPGNHVTAKWAKAAGLTLLWVSDVPEVPWGLGGLIPELRDLIHEYTGYCRSYYDYQRYLGRRESDVCEAMLFLGWQQVSWRQHTGSRQSRLISLWAPQSLSRHSSFQYDMLVLSNMSWFFQLC